MENLVKLPGLPHRSSRRSSVLRLVKWVPEDAAWSGQVISKLMRPGERVHESALRPDSTWPRVPLIQENAPPQGPLERGWRRHGQGDSLVFYTFDRAAASWIKRGEVIVTDGFGWTTAVKPLLCALFSECVGPQLVAAPDSVANITELVHRELARLQPADRICVAEALLNELSHIALFGLARSA